MKRLLVVVLGCAALILLFPIFVARNAAINYPVPFQTEAFAGHSAANGLLPCQCGSADCICDPGDLEALKAAENQSNTSVSNKGLTAEPLTPGAEPVLAMLALALLIAVLRMR